MHDAEIFFDDLWRLARSRNNDGLRYEICAMDVKVAKNNFRHNKDSTVSAKMTRAIIFFSCTPIARQFRSAIERSRNWLFSEPRIKISQSSAPIHCNDTKTKFIRGGMI